MHPSGGDKALPFQIEHVMKNCYSKINRRKLSLGELVSVVASCARSERETLAALADLFETGRVRVKDHGHLKKVKLLPGA